MTIKTTLNHASYESQLPTATMHGEDHDSNPTSPAVVAATEAFAEAYPVDPSVIGRVLTSEWGRRAFVGSVAATGLTLPYWRLRSFLRADDAFTAAYWSDGDTKLVPSQGADISPPLETAILNYPGYGDDGNHGELMQQTLYKYAIYPRSTPNAYFQYTGDYSPRSTTNLTDLYFTKLKPRHRHIYANSLGGQLAANSLLYADTAHPIDAFVLNSSPFTIENVRHSEEIKRVIKYGRLVGYKGDPIVEDISYIVRNLEDDGNHDIAHSLLEATTQTIYGNSPRNNFAALKILVNANPLDEKVRARSRGIINRDTVIVFFETKRTNTDDIVLDNESADQWSDLASFCHAEFKIKQYDKTGHAHIVSAVDDNKDFLREVARRAA